MRLVASLRLGFVLVVGSVVPAAAQSGYSTNFNSLPPGWLLDAPVGGVGWAVDASPSSFPSGVSRSGSSLNYNNGSSYPGAAAGSATSPSISLAGLANPVVRFWCNYDTETRGVAHDRRTLQIRSGDGATPLAEYQLASTGYSFDAEGGPTGGGPGPCGDAYVDLETGSPVSAWHQHTVRLDPAWGSVRIRFAFDAVDDERNGYAGWAIDDLAVESHTKPPLPGWPDMLPDTTSVDGDGNELDTCERQGSFLRWSWGATNAGDEGVHLIVGNHPDAILDQTHLFYHAEHSHYHMSQYSEFALWRNVPGQGFTKVRRGPKRSFCLLDSEQVIPGTPSSAPGCGAQWQQISYGWQDVYPLGTSGQEIDVSGLATGTDYWLVGTLDPLNRVRETDDTNQVDQIHFVLPSSNGQVAILDRSNPFPPSTAPLTISSATTGTFAGLPAVHVFGTGFDTTLIPVMYDQGTGKAEAPHYTILDDGEIWVQIPQGLTTVASIDLVSARGEVASTRVAPAGVLVYFSAAAVSGGNGNATVEPDECADLQVTLGNSGTNTATGVSATLSTSTPGVSIVQAASNYPDIPGGGAAANTTPFRLETASGFACGTSVDLVLNVNTANGGSFVVPFAVPSGSAGTPVSRASQDTPKPIPDLSSTESIVNVSGFTGTVAEVTVKVHVTHTYVGDLSLSLHAPDGTAVLLANRRGGNGDGYGGGCGSPTVFDDGASTPIGAGSPLFVGTFRPEQPLSALSGRSGSAVNGNWRLVASDNEGLDVGTIQCWSLDIAPASCTAGGGSCSGGPSPSVDVHFSSATIGGGNGNGTLDPDECNSLTVALGNAGSEAATGVSAVLSTATPGVTITQASSAYPNIPAGGTRSNSTAFQVSTGAGFTCGTVADLVLSVSTSNAGSFDVPFTLPSGGSATPITRNGTDTPKPIPDQGQTQSSVTVSGLSGAIGKVRVRVHVTHTYDRDLRMTLTGPDGASVLLTDRRGGNGDNYGTNCTSGRTVFDDAAPTPIAAGTAPFALGFKPEGPLSTFAGKSGAAANGTWTLTVSDHEGLDVGTLQCWTLEVVPSACTAGGGACGGGPPQVSLEFSSASVGGGNGNGVVDPDECNDLTVGVRNAGSSTATGVSGVLSSSTPGVSISQATSAYPDIPASAIRTNAAAFKVQTSSAFACGTNIQLSLALTTGNAGSFTLPFALASGGSTTPLVRSSTDTPKAIPDLGSTESVIAVSGFGGQVAKVVAKVHLTHTYDRDLRLSLVGPGGTSVLLADRRGGNGDGYGTSCSSLTVFDDAAATPIGSGTAPFAGSFRPEQPLSVFTGMTTNVNGNWRLHVSDNEGLDVGTIQCWTLEVTPQGCTPGGGGCP